jgi:hypothetical protein
MTSEQIRLLVQQYISTTLHECEESRASRVMSDEEREATWYGLTDVLEQTQSELLRNDYSKVADVADELLQTHQLMMDKATEEYQRFCRELLKARQAILRIELDRNEGDYTGTVPGDTSDLLASANVPPCSSRTILDLAIDDGENTRSHKCASHLGYTEGMPKAIVRNAMSKSRTANVKTLKSSIT